MLVTEIKKIDSKKSLIYLDYEPAFSIYRSEIRRYEIGIEKELTSEKYDEILAMLLKRCRERTAYILGKSDKSEHELKTKLRQGFYPDSIINKVVNEYTMMGYVNDYRYASNYIKYHFSSKSKNRIMSSLLYKGIDKELINDIMNEYESENEDFKNKQDTMIEKEFIKKKYDFESDDKELLHKIIASLCRKGFRYDDVKNVYHRLKDKCD